MKYIISVLILFVASIPAFSQNGWDIDDEPWDDPITVEIPLGQTGTQIINLTKGCNWISFFLNVSVPIEEFQKAGIVRVKSQDCESFNVSGKGMTGNLLALTYGDGYRVYADSDVDISVTGVYCSPEVCKPQLYKGWNWLGTPYQSSRSLSSAFANPEEGDVIEGQNSESSVFNGQEWSGTIKTLEPGKSYLYKSLSDKVLQFKQ